jgi:hypothetical protein
MVDDENYTEHKIQGRVSPEEWEKFLKQHFKPAGQGQAPVAPTDHSASGICAGLGCPRTFGGGNLHHCSVDVEHDGSATIHCYYEARAR